jgi:RHS repeat-associated protein
VGAEWTAVVGDAWGNPLSELKRTGATWTKARDYLWLDGRLLAQVEYEGTARTYYAHLDHLGTPRALTNQAGELIWSTFQRPYGEVGEKTVSDPLSGKTVVTNLRLPGQYDERLLASVGLQGPYYNWNRWYLPGVGRYLELDPLAMNGDLNGFGAPDWYIYALGNPLTYTDPNGENPGVGAALGAPICGPPCMVIGALAGLGAAVILGKIGSDAIRECAGPKKSGPCSCTCYRQGGDKNTSTSSSIGQQSSPAECARTCIGMGYPGSRCGSKDVTWQN